MVSLNLSGNPISDLAPLRRLKAANPDITIDININNNNAPVFTAGTSTTRSVTENTASGTNIGSPISATDADDDTLTYTLGGTDASSFSIVSTSGQLRTNAALNYESKSSYSVSVSVSDGNGGSDSIPVTINVTDVNEKPSFGISGRVTLTVPENTAANTNIGEPFQATDPDSGDTLTYSLQRDDKDAFSIDANTGQLKTHAALDYETKSSYSNLAVRATDSQGRINSVLVTINVTNVNENSAPVFSDGATTTRSIAENTASGTNIGSAVAATDADNHTLTYTLGGTDASSFSIVSTSGQLQTNTALNYESKSSYSVSVSVSDSNGGSDSIDVTINVTNVNEAPSFASSTTTRSIAENTASGQNIGTAVAATDVDHTSLAYTLGGTDASSFSIVSTSGQLRTSAALDRETKASYSVTVTATDAGNLSDTTTVTINVTNVNEAPSFASTTATRSIAENTAANTDIGAAITATDVDANTTLTYTLGGTDASSFSIVSTSGQLQTNATLDHETTASYSVTVTASDGSLSDTIDVTISVTDVNDAPVFTDGDTTTRTIAENSVANTNIGTAVTATDQDKKPDPANPAQLIAKDTITYSIPTTGDAAAFSIDSSTGQLKTKNALNYENKNAYTVVVTASDGSLTDTITVTISVTNVNEAPTFATGTSISDISATNGTAITSVTLPEATDVDANTTLTYTVTPALPAGLTFTASTRVLSGTPTTETASATYTYTASDGNLSATLTFSIQVSAGNNAPTFTDGSSTTRLVAENTASGQNIGTAVAATDTDNDVLTYTLGGTDASSFGIVSTTGQLQTSVALDRETKSSYSVTITADDGNTTNNTDSIDVTINVTNVNEKPSFGIFGRVTLSVAENTAANTNIGEPFQATDPDSGDTLTYSLQRGDKDSFRINASTGQLQTRAALDYETKNSYSNLAVRATDSEGLVNSVLVTVNVTNANEAPTFATGTSISNISATNGTAITSVTLPEATDPDANTTITYTVTPALPAGLTFTAATRLLSGTPTAVSASTTYTYTASDSTLSDTLTFTIQVNAANSAPTFTDGASTTRSIAENTASGQNIGTGVAATDTNPNDTLTYTLGGTDAASFSIVSTSGQLQTSAALDYETKSSYAVTVSVSDGRGGSDSIAVTINVTNANDNAPMFTDGSSPRRSVAENTAADTNVGTPVAATDPDGDTLQYTYGFAPDFSNTPDHDAFTIDSTTGQIKTKAALDYETRSDYGLYLMASDGRFSTQIPVRISVTDVNEAPSFTEGSTATRSIDQNATSGTNIGAAVAATDPDNTLWPPDTLTYTLSGTDASSFSIVSTSGQLQTKAALDYETKSSYAVTVGVSDGNGKSDTISVTINVTRPPLSDRTAQVRDAIVAVVPGVSNANDVTGAHLAAITSLDLSNKSITALKTGDFNGLTALTTLDLHNNSISDISALSNLTSMVTLTLSNNSIRNISALSGMTSIDTLTLNNNSIRNISALSGLTSMVTLNMKNNNVSDVSTLSGLTSLFIVTLAGNPISDYAPLRTLKTANPRVTFDINMNNNPPVFTEGATATRSVPELTASGTNIGDPIAATDADNHTLTYTLGGTDAASFSIVSTSGQLQTNAALNYDTKSSYAVTITVYDGNNGGDSISVTINVIDADAPVFTEGDSTTRTIAENTAAGQNIGTPVAATDPNADVLTYTLGGTDVASFSIISTSGQLQTSAALDYETKSSYSVTVSVSDGNGGSDSITVTINVTDVNETPTPPLSARTAQVRDAIVAAVPGVSNADDVTKAHLAAITLLDLTSKAITALQASDFSGLTGLEYLYLQHTSSNDSDKNSISDLSPLEGLTSLRDLNLGNNSVSDISVLSGLTLLNTLNLSDNSISDISALSGLTSMSILDLRNNNISDVSALSGMTSLFMLYVAGNPISDYATLRTLEPHLLFGLDISLTNNPPTFTDGTTTTRSVAENTASGTNIGTAVAATDADNHTLTYSLGGTDADAFSIVSTSGQLQTNAALDYETKSSYAVTVFVYDGNNGGDSIAVTINVTDVTNENNIPPVFTDGNSTTRTVAENTASGTNIGAAVAATDADTGDILTYTLSGADATSFSIVSTSGQLQTNAALDYETKTSYAVSVSVSDGNGGSDSIAVTVNVTNVNDNAPVFTEGTSTTRTVEENTLSGVNIGSAVSATDADTGDTLTYTLGGADATSFSIVSTSGQLQANAALDYETKTSYSVSVSVSDGNGRSDSINVTINVTDIINENAPMFTEGTSTTRSVEENTLSGVNIGSAVSATDVNNDTLLYSLSGADAASFSIVSTSGQLQTSAALDYETKTSYSVTVGVSDGNGGSDSIAVTINVTDIIMFTDGSSTTRSVAENTALHTLVGSPVAATHAANAPPNYTLSGMDEASFGIVSTSGQLYTNAAMDYEVKNSYTVTVSVSDSNDESDSITVTINITDEAESPMAPPLSDRTAAVRDEIVRRAPGVSNADDVTVAHLAAIRFLSLSNKSISALQTGDFNGLTGLTNLDLQRNSISDISALSGLTSLTDLDLQRNSISDISALSGMTSMETLGLSNNSISDISALSGMTSMETLYLNNNSISDISVLSGMTSMANLYLNNNSISDISALSGMTSMLVLNMKNNNITDVSVLSGMTSLFMLYVAGNPISDYATLRTLKASPLFWLLDISLTNNPPTFDDGATTTRSVAENTAAGQNIGTAVAAMDEDTGDTLSYTLGGTDADSFSIVSTSGQLQTKAALDYETKSSYTVAVTVYDGNNGGARITVTINVTDAVGAAPSIETPPMLPKTTELLSNYPNPFNPETWIPYQLSKPAEVTLTIYDIRGRIVRTLRLGHQPAGFYQTRSKAAHWDGRNYLGEQVATGIYFYTLKAGDYMATRKLLIRK